MANFDYYNITFSKSENSEYLVVRGEITNRAGRDYNAVAVRVILFVKNIPVANVIIIVNGLLNGRTKTFEKCLEELSYDKVAKEITRYEVYVESAY